MLVGNASDIDPDADVDILELASPVLSRTSSIPLEKVQVGEQLVVTTDVRNNDDVYDWPAYVILEIRDWDGVTIMLAWQSGVVETDRPTQVGVSWIPEHPGDYQLRTFAVSSLDNPRILSAVSVSEVTIASSSHSFPILIGNKTFDVQYSFASSEGMIQDMRVHPSSYPSIVAEVFVEHDTTVDIVLPRKLLEQMEVESGYHYCVGNAFVVFVKEVPMDSDQRNLDDMSQILTIPLSSGSNTLEIVGEDLLQSPPTCLHVGLPHYSFAKDLPGVQVDTWDDAVVIARDYLAQNNGGEGGAAKGNPLGSVELVYVHSNGTAFTVNRYDGLLEDARPHFNYTPTDSYYWIVTLNREEIQEYEIPRYILTIDAQTGEVKDMITVD